MSPVFISNTIHSNTNVPLQCSFVFNYGKAYEDSHLLVSFLIISARSQMHSKYSSEKEIYTSLFKVKYA